MTSKVPWRPTFEAGRAVRGAADPGREHWSRRAWALVIRHVLVPGWGIAISSPPSYALKFGFTRVMGQAAT
jgi:hypothetical protein